jgi:hypothetical protein
VGALVDNLFTGDAGFLAKRSYMKLAEKLAEKIAADG